MQTLAILAQAAPLANTLTDLYVAPGASAVSSVTICNQSSAPGTFRLSVAKAGVANDSKQYIYFDEPLPTKRAFVATIGISLSQGDVIRCQSSNAQTSFNVFGVTQ